MRENTAKPLVVRGRLLTSSNTERLNSPFVPALDLLAKQSQSVTSAEVIAVATAVWRLFSAQSSSQTQTWELEGRMSSILVCSE